MVELPENTEMVMPGDNISMTVELITPIAMDQGLRLLYAKGAVLLVPGLSLVLQNDSSLLEKS